jgi:hypothetical protein
MEIDLPVLLSELELTMEQFIDLCIMCGCDYASNIRGIGAVRALALIKQHGSIEAVIKVGSGAVGLASYGLLCCLGCVHRPAAAGVHSDAAARTRTTRPVLLVQPGC